MENVEKLIFLSYYKKQHVKKYVDNLWTNTNFKILTFNFAESDLQLV